MSRAKHPSVRITQAVLDLEYGDEQERLRYYEAYSLIVHLQLIALPVAGAAAVFGFGTSAVVPALILLGAAFLPVFVGIAYLRQRGVRLEVIAANSHNRPFAIAYLLACSLMVVAVLANSGVESSGSIVVGAVIGVGLGIAGVAIQSRRQRTQDADDSSSEL